MDTGETEVFGPSDIFHFPVWWFQVHAYFGQTPGLILAFFVAYLAIVLLVIGLFRRGRRAALRS